MRRIFLILIVAIGFGVSASVSAQDEDAPHFGDDVEMLNVETPPSPTALPQAAVPASTFCGNIQPYDLAGRWVFKADQDQTRLCSPYEDRLSSPLPEGYTWLPYESRPILVSESPAANTVVFAGLLKAAEQVQLVYFRYDIETDAVTKLGLGQMYTDLVPRIQWLTDEILLVTTTNHGANTIYDPTLNVVDLRYNDVSIIKGASPYTQEDQIVVEDDPLQITVKDLTYLDLFEGNFPVQHVYCRETVYDLLSRRKQEVDYGEFCNLVGGDRYGVGYYLVGGYLWRYNPNMPPNGYRIVDAPVNHVQRWDKRLLIYTDDRVLELDTGVENPSPQIFFDHPALTLLDPVSTVPSTSPFHYFITADGLLRVNTETDSQDLLFKGSVSLVDWIDPERGLAALIYQQIVDNFPPYISPNIHDDDPYSQPAYSEGKLALVNLKTGAVIFEINTRWNKMREWYDGSWLNYGIRDWGQGWFQPAYSGTVFIVHFTGDQVDSVETNERVTPLVQAEDWLLVHDNGTLSLSLLNRTTGESIFVADRAQFPVEIHYEGDGEFSWKAQDGKIYHFRVAKIRPT